MITKMSRAVLVALTIGAAVAAGTGAATADVPDQGSSSLILGGSSALMNSYSGFMNSFGSTNSLAGAVAPINGWLANLVCIFGGAGSGYNTGVSAPGSVPPYCNSEF